MSKKRTIIERPKDQSQADRIVVEESIDPKDSPAVMAYRLGELEKAVRDGFRQQTEAFNDLVKGFVTEKELNDIQDQNKKEHDRLWGAINGIKRNTRWWVTTIIAAILATATLGAFVVDIIRH